MAKLCPFRKASWVPTPPDPDPEDPTFDPEDGSWLWVTRPPYNATGNGTTDDRAAIQACINAAASAGKKVYLPAGTYHMIASGGTGLSIPSNTTIRGVGETSILRLYDAGIDARHKFVDANGKANVTLQALKITGTQTNKEASVQLVQASGASNMLLKTVTFGGAEYALRTTSGYGTANGIIVDGCTTLESVLNPFYISVANNVEVRDCTLAANTVDCMPSRFPHHFYINQDVDNIYVHDCTLTGGQHWAIDIHTDGSPITGDITFEDITFANAYACMWIQDFAGTGLFQRFGWTSNRGASSVPMLFLYTASGVTVYDCTFAAESGKGQWLVDASHACSNHKLQNVLITNSAYSTATPKGYFAEYGSGTPPQYINVTVNGSVVNYP
jgi:pectate lyase